MSTDRDTTRIVRSWLKTDDYESADRVLDAVLDQLDTTPQRRATWWTAWMSPFMNTTTMRFGIGAAALLALIFLGLQLLPGSNVGGPIVSDEPSPSPTASATRGRLEPGCRPGGGTERPGARRCPLLHRHLGRMGKDAVRGDDPQPHPVQRALPVDRVSPDIRQRRGRPMHGLGRLPSVPPSTTLPTA